MLDARNFADYFPPYAEPSAVPSSQFILAVLASWHMARTPRSRRSRPRFLMSPSRENAGAVSSKAPDKSVVRKILSRVSVQSFLYSLGFGLSSFSWILSYNPLIGVLV